MSVRRLALYGALGVLAPLVLLAILMERDFRRRAGRFFARLASSLEPVNDRLKDELHEWRADTKWDEVLSWMMDDRTRR